MIRSAFTRQSYYCPFGDSAPVSLTQDLPPEQNVDILFLGCGDARNVLFTCFANDTRKIDATCCDIEPMIHARNVLLYTLLIDDEKNVNLERIWNIYYHWKLDNESAKLLETQIQKVLQVSETMDQWRTSVYGSSIRFCDERSLTSVRTCWVGFQLQGLDPSEKKHRLNKLQATIDRMNAIREKVTGTSEFPPLPDREECTSPIQFKALQDLMEVVGQWWKCGTMTSSRASAEKPTELNPAVLYSLYPTRQPPRFTQPLLGIPVCTAYTPICKGSPFRCECKKVPSPQRVVDCAKSHFEQWASAFRRAVDNKSVIRIFSGDALAFGFTLRNCQITHKRSMNLPCDSWTTKLLELSTDYDDIERTAPVSFDIVDTSTLVDVLGPINVIPIASTLLKYHASSSLYAETLDQPELLPIGRLRNFFGSGIDVRLMSLLLGLVEPDLFTNATNSFIKDQIFYKETQITEWKEALNFQRSRLRWKRLKECQELGNFPCVHVEAKALAKFLSLVYAEMFKREDKATMTEMILLTQPMPLNRFDPSSIDSGPTYTEDQVKKVMDTDYNRASFASLLSFLKMTIVTDWNQCVKDIYENVFFVRCLNRSSAEDMLLNMRLFGVYDSPSQEPNPADVQNAILAASLPSGEVLPHQLCVSVCVPREQLAAFSGEEKTGLPAFSCVFHNRDPDEKVRPWACTFSTIWIAFGTWHEKTEENESHPFTEEDKPQPLGSSDMCVSVMVPTDMLLWSKKSVPWVKLKPIPTLASCQIFYDELLGKDHIFANYEMTSKNVFISRYMPGMSEIPVIAPANVLRDEQTSAEITVRLTADGSKIDSSQMSSNRSVAQVNRSETSQPSARGRGPNQNRNQNRRRNRNRN